MHLVPSQWKPSGSNVFRYFTKPESHRNFVLFWVFRAQVLSLHACRRTNTTSRLFPFLGDLTIVTIVPSLEGASSWRHSSTSG